MQVAWSSLNWPPFTITVQENLMPYFPFNFLGDQLMWTLAIFSPLCLFPSPGIAFLVAQVIIICFGAVLLYRISSYRLEDQWLALLVTVCFLFNPATIASFEKFGFRAETLFIPLIFALFYFLDKERIFAAASTLILFLLTKHNTILTAGSLGLYFIVFDRKRWRFGVFCILAAVAYYVVGVELILAHLQTNPVVHFKHFSPFGNTPGEVLINMISHPEKIVSMISKTELAFMGQMLFPAGFLSLLSPVFWLSSTELLINAVMTDYHSVYCAWHWTIVVPFVFLGMISTASWLMHKFAWRQWVRYLFGALLIFQIVLNIRHYSSTVMSGGDNFYFKGRHLDTSKIDGYLSSIEPKASVMVSAQLLWRFFNREQVYNARVKFHDDVDYIIILLPLGRPEFRQIDALLIQELPALARKEESKFKDFNVVVSDSNLLMLKHK